MNNALSVASAAKAACGELLISSEQKNRLLSLIADKIEASIADVERANALDVCACVGKPDYFIDRLRFDEKRIRSAADGLRKLTEFDDPVGQVKERRTLDCGIKIKKITVPFGVIAIVYEARPNVTLDAAGLCLKAGNAVVLRGSRDASNTNRAVVAVIKSALESCGINPDVVGLAECDRDGVKELLAADKFIDLAIPRGSKNLIDFVRANATVPVIETGAGNCCAYIDGTCDVALTAKAVVNAKTNRISVCNALESVFIAEDALERSLPVLKALSSAGVTVHGDSAVCKLFPTAVPAVEDDYYTEYLSMDISVKTVTGLKDAVESINKYGTHHSDVIFSTNKKDIEYFYNRIDSAVVYSNASTRFTDGFRFGLGAEIGISTQKLHARGPMGLNEIVTYKYIAEGDGQILE